MKNLAIMLITLLFVSGCSDNSKLQGKVVDVISNAPLEGVNIVAITKTNIIEDKKYERRETTTNKEGQFLLKGLSPRYSYEVTVQKAGYASDNIYVNPPDANNTKLLERPLQICALPSQVGISIWENDNWRLLQNNSTFKVVKTGIRPSMAFNTILDIYLPTKLGEKDLVIANLEFKSNQSVTNWIEGKHEQLTEIENIYAIKSPALFGILGENFNNYELMPLYYFPKSLIYDKRGKQGYPGSFNIDEGYHIGIQRVRGVGKCCRYLDLKRETTEISMSKVCSNSVSSLKYGYFHISRPGYYAIVPGGKLNLYQSKGLDDLLRNGLQGIIFKAE